MAGNDTRTDPNANGNIPSTLTPPDETPAAPTGSAALNPANGSAATTIPSGPQTVPGQQGSAALNPAVNGDKATSIPSGPETAAGAPTAPTPAAQKRVYNGPRDTVGHMAESANNHVVFGQEESLARIVRLARG
jgi:hypothetical protein